MGGKRRKSKKRSAANSDSLPEPITFFVDRSLGKRFVPNALSAAGAQLRIHDDLFPSDAPDTEWLRRAGRERWVVLSKDCRIRTNPLERKSLVQHNVAAFVLTAREIQGPEMAQIFVDALPTIESTLRKVKPPFVATITRHGYVQVLFPETKRTGHRRLRPKRKA